ncbi:MAG: ethanolamine utilization protein EutJ [Deltaproteobacteria bacterium GWA2_38_16]|nr:MAG: ethanolamine utilization protein EutJ [Deltaproteobacteria bacterium GWA2_38_16]OGQ01975.1 MAG: ethanolamine utilization protein EutJ [Deltaproteobacteria bacterium RIFCSPHIGHO2_02_FULL_38_15]OGQ33670.1 MAG: ethanolamine utilization protein EutJ [Deltaproteobacteria bacterium RIFCSPLOWO2_01_FULL_38_9]HBQ21508.1 ethanolamine utilization protein EutJ [Deltaproteobacteria bacterium]
MKKVNFLLLSTLLIFSLTSCTKKTDQNVIKVGEYGSLTGSEATFGTSTHNGIMLAIDELNSAGGIAGKKIKVITVDDQGKPEEAASAVTKLITSDKVAVILGEVASSRSLAGAPIAQRYKIPMVSPSSTNPKVTQVGNYIFRTCFIDPFQGKVMANFAKNTLKAKKVAILRDVKSDYSVGLAEFFTKTFTDGGGKVVVDLSYTAGDIDFKAQLTTIRSKGVEAIFVPGYYTEVGLIARQAKELGVSVPLLGGDGWDSARLTEIAGNSLDNSYFSNHYTAESKDPRVAEFVEKYKKVFGQVPDGLAAMGYDAALVLIDALKRAKTLTPDDIRDALAATKNFQAVTGVISFNDNRDAEKAAVVLAVKNGQFKFVETVNP